MAYPQAIAIVKACVDTAMQLGLPEAQLPLAQAAVLLATAPKSNSVIEGIGAAWADVKASQGGVSRAASRMSTPIRPAARRGRTTSTRTPTRTIG